MDKKTAILKEAARLFAEKGFNQTSTAEIAKAAGTASGTVFYHFRTKDGILKEIYHNLVAEYMAGIADAEKEAKSGLDGIKTVLAFHFSYGKQHIAEFTVLHRDMPVQINYDDRYEIVRKNTATTVALFKRCIEKGIKDGSIRPDADADGYAALLKAMLVGTTRMTHLSLIDFSDPERVVTEFCVSALTNMGTK